MENSDSFPISCLCFLLSLFMMKTSPSSDLQPDAVLPPIVQQSELMKC